MSHPKIRSLRIRPVRVPLPVPHTTASGTIAESPLVLTDIESDDGSIGHSIVFTYTTAAMKPVADLIAAFGEWIKNDPSAPLDVEKKLNRRLRLLGPQGLTGIAVAAIDMALWDAAARRQQISLAQLLGGTATPINVYGAVGYDGVDTCARTAEDWARRGFTGVKAKIGYPSVAEDVAVIRAMRAASGPDMAIMVDYNQCLTPTEAVQRMRALDDEGLTWVEEPTLAHDYAGHALIAREAATPIQAGENWWGPLDMQHAIDANATDYLMPDVMKIGGVTGWMRAAALAHSVNKRASSHLWPEVSAQLLAVTPTAHWLEYADWWNPILADPLTLTDGQARFDGVIGSGVEWNNSAVERYAA